MAKSELKGQAILDHPCGKVSVKQMGLAHDGKMEEANKLTTKKMQEHWKSKPAKAKAMMSGKMKEMSQAESAYPAYIKANVDMIDAGLTAPRTVKTVLYTK